jgi:hypothetical protein
MVKMTKEESKNRIQIYLVCELTSLGESPHSTRRPDRQHLTSACTGISGIPLDTVIFLQF